MELGERTLKATQPEKLFRKIQSYVIVSGPGLAKRIVCTGNAELSLRIH